ncbi:hypothetical protein Barba22A_gp058 [Rheinheimera phage vB_RspM_Barba22A]|jgi:hypothetical protein|uniref:Uncharacterized protein n=75 Tax=Barbavirus TaxID=2733095 RepID=A0A7G9VRT8_9CAUD|nr:hypothetical protein HOV45_gp062 [Rheinheimera phage Barba8S]YP_009822935.1 hypothetical protein HOV46_gp058 [Rheinheimera phage vB_RspM_Barba18A]QCQ57909.1 hypothetical protein Barba1A_gp058 [Rheinheimera phage vB_RspM_Barba1A]QCQ58045.1 hypothetical protein Barba1S_gp058 [Rheinheimera phage vB_RspM_Barba1S]QCQ58181.1 hypothetical protein Barba2A_gp058 [Rheinheimera phage vB_RspM_Barba2A]QCQ58317.1 hypothetical protein Barba2S_gp058 [Rheinheimera phage vB_RspM_Barba2S]QCQ58591.1 hypotheti
MIKNIVVVCNNLPEWGYFVDSLQWSLSKQNLPYQTKDNYITDIQNNKKFIHVPNSMYKLSQIMYMMSDDDFYVDSIIWMCNTDKEVEDYLGLFMGGGE